MGSDSQVLGPQLRNQNLGSWHTWTVTEPECEVSEEKCHGKKGALGEAAGEAVGEMKVHMWRRQTDESHR